MRNKKPKIRKPYGEKKHKGKGWIVFIILVLVVLDVYAVIRYYKDSALDKIKDEVTIEAPDSIQLEDFLNEQADTATFVTDISSINTSVTGSYLIRVKAGKFIEVTKDVVLNVVDTTAPVGTAVPQTVYTDEIPAAEDTVTGIYDVSPVTVEYAEEMPEVLHSGEQTIGVKLTDSSGNYSIVDVPFAVIDDHTAPLIKGAKDFEAFIGDAIIYMDGITVTDDYDDNPTIEVDTSAVDVTTEGVYPVTYTATDNHGNTSSVTVELTLRVKPERYYEPEEIYELAREVMEANNIVDDSMSDIEKAFKITAWVSENLHYKMDSDKCDWTAGAYDALTTMYGDCYNFMAMCKAMYGACGIESITVERYPINVSSHYWNLVKLDGKWYHCDACVFLNMTDITYIFMYTDDELSPSNNSYDPETLPDDVVVATQSVQYMLDYETQTVIDDEAQT